MPSSHLLLLTATVCALGLAEPAFSQHDVTNRNPEPEQSIDIPDDIAAAYDAGAYDDVVDVIQAMADQGISKAQLLLGEMYATGNGIKQSWRKARQSLTRAAEGGNGVAASRLGWMYRGGRGVKRNFEESAEWYALGVEHGDVPSMAVLADMYGAGQGVEQDFAQALALYRRAAATGHVNAIGMIGSYYFQGRSVEKDDAEAARWYRLAAEAGDSKWQTMLASFYQNGVGVEKDLVEAYKWYALAETAAKSEFCATPEYRQSLAVLHMTTITLTKDHVATLMDEAQIEQGQRAADAWPWPEGKLDENCDVTIKKE